MAIVWCCRVESTFKCVLTFVSPMPLFYLPAGVSKPSFSLKTISVCPSIINFGGRFAYTSLAKMIQMRTKQSKVLLGKDTERVHWAHSLWRTLFTLIVPLSVFWTLDSTVYWGTCFGLIHSIHWSDKDEITGDEASSLDW